MIIFNLAIRFFKKWLLEDFVSGYTFFGLTIINYFLYSLYYFLEPVFSPPFLFYTPFFYSLIDGKPFPFYGFYFLILPPLISSYLVRLESRILNPILKVIMIIMTIILALVLTLAFMPLSVFIFAAYISLGAIISIISYAQYVFERLKLPQIIDGMNIHTLLKMRHDLLIQMLAYSIWAVVTVIFAGLSLLFFSPLTQEMVKAGGLKTLFVVGQGILVIFLMVYYSIGLIQKLIIPIIEQLLEVEEKTTR